MNKTKSDRPAELAGAHERMVRWRAQLYRDSDYVRIFPGSNKDDNCCTGIMDVHIIGEKNSPADADEALKRALLVRTGRWRKQVDGWWEAFITRIAI